MRKILVIFVILLISSFLLFPTFEVQACHHRNRYDFNRDGKVDMLDLTLMLAHYNQDKPRRCDLNRDGIIDIYDVVSWIYGSGYGRC